MGVNLDISGGGASSGGPGPRGSDSTAPADSTDAFDCRREG